MVSFMVLIFKPGTNEQVLRDCSYCPRHTIKPNREQLTHYYGDRGSIYSSSAYYFICDFIRNQELAHVGMFAPFKQYLNKSLRKRTIYCLTTTTKRIACNQFLLGHKEKRRYRSHTWDDLLRYAVESFRTNVTCWSPHVVCVHSRGTIFKHITAFRAISTNRTRDCRLVRASTRTIITGFAQASRYSKTVCLAVTTSGTLDTIRGCFTHRGVQKRTRTA